MPGRSCYSVKPPRESARTRPASNFSRSIVRFPSRSFSNDLWRVCWPRCCSGSMQFAFLQIWSPRADLNGLTASGEVDRLESGHRIRLTKSIIPNSRRKNRHVPGTAKPYSIASRVFPMPPCRSAGCRAGSECDGSSSAGHARARPAQRGRCARPFCLSLAARRADRSVFGTIFGATGGRASAAVAGPALVRQIFSDVISKNVTFMQQVVRKCRTVAIFVSFSVSDVGRLAYGPPCERELPGRESDGGVQQPGGTSSQTP